mgnify:FL=1
MPDPACLRVIDVAARWSCSPGKVRAMLRTGELTCLRLGKMVRIPIAALHAFEARCQQQTETDPASAASERR